MPALATQIPIDVYLSNHPDWDGSIQKMNRLRAGNASAGNLFVVGRRTIDRTLEVMDECARAQSGPFGLP